MELEIRELPSPDERSRQLNHMQSFKAELKRLEREYSLTKRRVQRHEDRSKLLDDEELDTSHLDSNISHNAKDRFVHRITLLCFFKFVSQANNSKSCPPNKWPRHKNVAIGIFLEQTTLHTCGFWAGEALEAWTWDYLNITLAQKWHSDIFQISADKSFQALQNKFPALIEWM